MAAGYHALRSGRSCLSPTRRAHSRGADCLRVERAFARAALRLSVCVGNVGEERGQGGESVRAQCESVRVGRFALLFATATQRTRRLARCKGARSKPAHEALSLAETAAKSV